MINNMVDENWSLEVVTTTQEDALHLQPGDDTIPTKVKIRVKKRDSTGFSRQGFISVPKLKHKYEYTKQFRAVHSDQTIMSFNMYTKSEQASSPPRKSQNKFFHLFKTGKCLGTQSEDDKDPPYMLTTSISSSDVNTQNLKDPKIKRLNINSENISDVNSLMEDIRPPLYFFGKCKRGGCLDPPFGEDKYLYQPSIQPQQIILKDEEKLVKPVSPEKLNERKSKHSEITVKISISTTKKSSNEDTQTITTLMPIKVKSKNSLLKEKFSDSIITYSPEKCSVVKNTSCNSKRSSVVNSRNPSTVTDIYLPHLKEENIKTQKNLFRNDLPSMDVLAIADRSQTEHLQVKNVISGKVYTVSESTEILMKPEPNLTEENGDTGILLRTKDTTVLFPTETDELNISEIINLSLQADHQLSPLLKKSITNMCNKDKSKEGEEPRILKNVTSSDTETKAPLIDKDSWLLPTVSCKDIQTFKPANDQEGINIAAAPAFKENICNMIEKIDNSDSFVEKNRTDLLEKSRETNVLDHNAISQENIKSILLNKKKNSIKNVDIVEDDMSQIDSPELTKTNRSSKISITEKGQSKLSESQLLDLKQHFNTINLTEPQDKVNTVLDIDKIIDKKFINHTDEGLDLISKNQFVNSENKHEINLLTQENKSIALVNRPSIETVIEDKFDYIRHQGNNINIIENIAKDSVLSFEEFEANESDLNYQNAQNSKTSEILSIENIVVKDSFTKTTLEKTTLNEKKIEILDNPFVKINEDNTLLDTILVNIDKQDNTFSFTQENYFDSNNELNGINEFIKNMIEKGIIAKLENYMSYDLSRQDIESTKIDTTFDQLTVKRKENDFDSNIELNGINEFIKNMIKKGIIAKLENYMSYDFSRQDIESTKIDTTFDQLTVKRSLSMPISRNFSRENIETTKIDTTIDQSTFSGSFSIPINKNEEIIKITTDNLFLKNKRSSELQDIFASEEFSKTQPINSTDYTSNKNTEDCDHKSVENEIKCQAPTPSESFNPIISETLRTKKFKNTVIVDLGFQTYINEQNERVIRTFDVNKMPERLKNDSVSKITSTIDINDKKLVLKINSKTQLFVEIKHTNNFPEIFENSYEIKESARKSNKHDLVTENYKHLNNMDIKNLQKTLTALYEYDLVPVENLIKSLVLEIEKISKLRVLLKKKYIAAEKIKVLKPTKSNKCACLRK